MHQLLQFIQDNIGHTLGAIMLLSVFIEIVPIKINPLSWLFSKLGKAIFGVITKDINTQIGEELKNLNDKIDRQNETINEQNDKLNLFIDDVKQNNQVIMRDRLTQIYHYTLQKGYILEKDNANFNSLLDRYIQNGGNSYIVHDVAPRMKSFHVYLTDEAAKSFHDSHGCY